jgi:hypothetical protein
MKKVLKFALLAGALLSCTNPVAPNSGFKGEPPLRSEPPSIPSSF